MVKSASYVSTRRLLSRRHVLAGAGATAVGLPLLEVMTPVFGNAQPSPVPPKRFVGICASLGLHCPLLFPSSPGRNYELTPYLMTLKNHRDQMTILSGLSHPEQQGNNGHASELTWLTSAPRPGLAGFRNTISLDQLIADKVGVETRFPFLALSTSGRSMSWTATGVEIPGETSPARLFKSLFMEGTPAEVAAEMRRLERGRSILDTVLVQARSLEQNIGQRDRDKLDEYLTAVRDLETRLQQSQGWSRIPRPHVNADAPKDVVEKADAIARQKLMYDMIVLGLQTDSTRSVTFQLSGMNATPLVPGVKNDWHNLSHHGRDPEKIQELTLIEQAEFAAFNDFLNQLKSVSENGSSLLDHTAVLFGSNLGNASSHDWHNLPIILAGGGYRHAGYLAYDSQNNTPLANLFVSLAQRMGIETDHFGSSTAAGLNGLEHS